MNVCFSFTCIVSFIFPINLQFLFPWFLFEIWMKSCTAYRPGSDTDICSAKNLQTRKLAKWPERTKAFVIFQSRKENQFLTLLLFNFSVLRSTFQLFVHFMESKHFTKSKYSLTNRRSTFPILSKPILIQKLKWKFEFSKKDNETKNVYFYYIAILSNIVRIINKLYFCF